MQLCIPEGQNACISYSTYINFDYQSINSAASTSYHFLEIQTFDKYIWFLLVKISLDSHATSIWKANQQL